MESRQSSEPKTSRAKPRTRCPASDAAEVAAFVERWGLPRGHPQQARFLDFHCGKGNLMADWAAAWRTWLRNTTRFEGRGSLVQQVPSTGHEWLAPEEWAT